MAGPGLVGGGAVDGALCGYRASLAACVVLRSKKNVLCYSEWPSPGRASKGEEKALKGPAPSHAWLLWLPVQKGLQAHPYPPCLWSQEVPWGAVWGGAHSLKGVRQAVQGDIIRRDGLCRAGPWQPGSTVWPLVASWARLALWHSPKAFPLLLCLCHLRPRCAPTLGSALCPPFATWPSRWAQDRPPLVV